jgi:hypothetical protein
VRAAWIVRQMRRIWRRDLSLEILAEADASILLFYLLVAGPWFQAWYAVWPVALIALLPEDVLARGALLVSLAATRKMPLFEFVLVPGTVLPPRDWRERRITLGTLGLEWAFFTAHCSRNWMRRWHGSSTTHSRETADGGTNQDAADTAAIG